MEDNEIKEFIKKIEIESSYKKIVKSDIIYQLLDVLKCNCTKLNYENKIHSAFDMAMRFYKEYNEKYYRIIMNGIENERIIFSKNEGKSFVNTESGIACIRLNENDSDLFIIVHELAHYIDRNSNPKIVPDEYWPFSEIFSFYIEKRLELWLDSKEYKNLISTRRNNRIYYESKMLKVVEAQLFYEQLYKEKGTISKSDIDFEKIKLIKSHNESNLVNYLLQYPFANIVSSYLIQHYVCINDDEFVPICLNIDLYEILRKHSNKKLYL